MENETASVMTGLDCHRMEWLSKEKQKQQQQQQNHPNLYKDIT